MIDELHEWKPPQTRMMIMYQRRQNLERQSLQRRALRTTDTVHLTLYLYSDPQVHLRKVIVAAKWAWRWCRRTTRSAWLTKSPKKELPPRPTTTATFRDKIRAADSRKRTVSIAQLSAATVAASGLTKACVMMLLPGADRGAKESKQLIIVFDFRRISGRQAGIATAGDTLASWLGRAPLPWPEQREVD